jgi:hypothetical protein
MFRAPQIENHWVIKGRSCEMTTRRDVLIVLAQRWYYSDCETGIYHGCIYMNFERDNPSLEGREVLLLNLNRYNH